MKIKKLNIGREQENQALAHRTLWEGPLVSLQREINRKFDQAFDGWPVLAFSRGGEAGFMPRVNVADGEKEITVTADLPGLDEKDVEVTINRGVLTLKGEKKEEQEEQKKNYYYVERATGMFQREISLPDGMDETRAAAVFKKGVLTVTIPKLPETQAARKKIPIKSE